MKVPRDISDRVLVLGPTFEHPRGGIAQVMNWHRAYVYESYHAIVNSSSGLVRNALLIVWSMLRMVTLLAIGQRYAIVHIHTSARRSFLRSSWFVSVARMMRRKVVLHIHGGDIIDYCEKHRGACRDVFNRCAAVVVLDRRWQDYFERQWGLTNVTVIDNIVPPPVPCNERPAGDGRFHVIYLGRVVEDKGIFELLEALAEFGDRLKSRLMLHVVGDGRLPQFTNEVGRLGLEDCVSVHGWIEGIEKARLLHRCHAMVLPSHYEGISLALLEAMTYHLPIIATNVGGNATLVRNGLNGLLYELGDNRQLISHLKYFADNREVARRMGQSSDELLAAYRPEVAARQLDRLYRQLMA